MSKNTLIKTNKLHRRNMKINTSEGEIQFNDKLEAEVSLEIAQKLEDLNIDIFIVKEKANSKIDSSEEEHNKNKESTSSDVESEVKEEEINLEEVKKALLKKTVKELQALATENKLPFNEWGDLNKINLVDYLLSH